MKLNYDRKSNDPTYFVQKGYRNGKKTTTKNVFRIGKHSELLKITDDPLAYAKEICARYTEEEKREKENKDVSMEVIINTARKMAAGSDIVSRKKTRNIGYFFLQKIYHDLDISSFFRDAAKNSRITFDPNQVNRFLTFAHIMAPDSKLGTFENLYKYYEEPGFLYEHIMRTMDIMEEHYGEYISHLFERSSRVVKRDTSICYYDCTNYYFEAEVEDADYVDEVTGEAIKGLRQFGCSKQHQPNPLVQMGLFMDKDGIPISMCITPGNQNEQTTAIPLEKEMMKMFKGKKFIYCADAGLGSLNIRSFNAMGGRSFIVTQSVKKLSDTLKEAVFNDYGYKLLSSDNPVSIKKLKEFDRKDSDNLELYNDKAYKIIEADKSVDLGLMEENVLKNGSVRMVKAKGCLKQKIIITFSRKMMEYQRFIRSRQVERAKKMLENIDPETYKKGPNDVRRFIKHTAVSGTGKKVRHQYELDQDKIAEEEKYDGYYAVATNLDDSAGDILAVSANRYKIEDCFRVMKTDFGARPVNHHKREHITAHFMICYTALLIFRILQKKLDDNDTHFTVDNIVETLQNMEVLDIQDQVYVPVHTGSQVLTALNSIFPIGLEKEGYLPKELNKILRSIK